MKIGEMIKILQEYQQEEGSDVEVIIEHHVIEYNSSGYQIKTEVDDVSVNYGLGKTWISIETILKPRNIADVRTMENELIRNSLVDLT